MRTPDHAGPQPDPLPPGKRVDPQVPGHHRHVQVVPALGLYVHVATEDLRKWIQGGGNDLGEVKAKVYGQRAHQDKHY